MLEELRKLLILQDRDLKIRESRSRADTAPRERAALDKKLEERRAAFAEHKTAAQKLEAERKDLNNQVKGLEDRIGKLRAQQQQTRRNEEYAALGREVVQTQGQIREIEDRELELMEQYEAAQKTVGEESRALAEFEKAVAAQMAQIDARAKVASDELAGLEAGRGPLAEGITEAVLVRYGRLFNVRGERPVVPVGPSHTCGGCYMTVSAQTAIDARLASKEQGSRELKIAVCEHCGRFMHWTDE